MMIQFKNVTFSYKHTPLFQNFNQSFGRGEKWAVVGPSGCGKSTLLNLLSGLVKPISGEILIDGMVLSRPRYKTGLILQDYGLLPWSNVRENILLGKRLQGRSRRSFTGNIDTEGFLEYQKWVSKLHLSDLQNKYPHQLSGGQKQRVAIARTFVLNPDLILLDEPFSALDEPTRKVLSGEIDDYCNQNSATLVMVSHGMHEVSQLCEHVLVITDLAKQAPFVIHLSKGPERIEEIKKIRSLIGNAKREPHETNQA